MKDEVLRMIGAVRSAIGSGVEEGAVREQLLAVLADLEDDLASALLLPEERQERARRSIEAKLVGLLELSRLEVVKAKRDFMLGALHAAFAFARSLIIKV